jgi:rhamnosyl/mannosyltransferase
MFDSLSLKNIKILQLGKFFPIEGGVEKVMFDLLMGLSAQQVTCDMLCTNSKNNTAQDIQINPYSKILLVPKITKVAATMIAPALITRLRQIANDYNIIHIHHPDPMACLALFCSGFKGKVILHWHSDILKQKNLLKIYMPLQSWLIKRADLIVGTTPIYVKQSPYLQKVQHKIDFIPIGVDPMVPEPQKVALLKEQYNGKKIIFSLGRLVAYKGHQYLIEAAKSLPDDYIILIGGIGPLENELRKQIRENELEQRVQLIGYIPEADLPNYYAASCVFCLPSVLKTEGFAIVQIESMSCGRPVVSTNIPESGVSWVNRDKESGYIIEICNPIAIAKAIIKICENKNHYDFLSKSSLKRYQDFFTKSKMVERSMQCYHQLLNNTP